MQQQQQQQQQQPPPAAAGSNLIPFELLVGVPLGNKRSIRVVIRIYIYTHKYNLFISFLFARVCSVTTKTGLIASFFGVFFSVSCVNKPEERINNGPTVPSHPRHISLTFFPPLFLSSFSFSFFFFFLRSFLLLIRVPVRQVNLTDEKRPIRWTLKLAHIPARDSKKSPSLSLLFLCLFLSPSREWLAKQSYRYVKLVWTSLSN